MVPTSWRIQAVFHLVLVICWVFALDTFLTLHRAWASLWCQRIVSWVELQGLVCCCCGRFAELHPHGQSYHPHPELGHRFCGVGPLPEKENKGAYEKLIKAKRFLTEAARVQWLDFEVWNKTGVSQECSEVRRSTLPTFSFKQRRTADKTMNVSARLLCIWSHIAWLVIIGESRIYWYVIDIQMEREMNR